MATSNLPQVGAPDPELETSPIVEEEFDEEAATVDPGAEDDGVCLYNGVPFAVGDYVCAGSDLLRCERGGVWAYKGSCHE